jgi:hypothetical protein
MIQDKDWTAITEMVARGEAIELPSGTGVRAVKSADFFINWQVRPIGSSEAWWVSGGDTSTD